MSNTYEPPKATWQNEAKKWARIKMAGHLMGLNMIQQDATMMRQRSQDQYNQRKKATAALHNGELDSEPLPMPDDDDTINVGDTTIYQQPAAPRSTGPSKLATAAMIAASALGGAGLMNLAKDYMKPQPVDVRPDTDTRYEFRLAEPDEIPQISLEEPTP